jgi:hypothetical protein
MNEEADALFYCYSDRCKGELQDFVEAWKIEGKKRPKARVYARRYFCCVCKSSYRPEAIMVDEDMVKLGQANANNA